MPTVPRSAYVRCASVTVRCKGGAVFQFRYGRGESWTPRSVSTRQIDSDPVSFGMHPVDELADRRRRGGGTSRLRGTSSVAKKIEAAVRISLASSRSRTSRSRSLIRCCSAVVPPGALSASIRACRVHVRRDSTAIPSFAAMVLHAAYGDGYSPEMVQDHLHRSLTLLGGVTPGHDVHPLPRREAASNPWRFSPALFAVSLEHRRDELPRERRRLFGVVECRGHHRAPSETRRDPNHHLGRQVDIQSCIIRDAVQVRSVPEQSHELVDPAGT